MLQSKWCVYIVYISLCGFLAWCAFSHVLIIFVLQNALWLALIESKSCCVVIWMYGVWSLVCMYRQCSIQCSSSSPFHACLFFYSPTKEPCIWLPTMSFFIPRTISGCQLKRWVDMIEYRWEYQNYYWSSSLFPANPRLADTFALLVDVTFRKKNTVHLCIYLAIKLPNAVFTFYLQPY